MSDIHSLHQLAETYLDECLQALALTDAGPPGRAYVSPGPPAWDCCDQITVHLGLPGMTVADTQVDPGALGGGHRVATLQMVNLVTMSATVLRCAPTLGDEGELPNPADMTAAARTVNEDLWAIWNWMTSRKRKAAVFAPKEREFYLDSAIAQNQQGECCGWVIPIRVQLDGWRAYQP